MVSAGKPMNSYYYSYYWLTLMSFQRGHGKRVHFALHDFSFPPHCTPPVYIESRFYSNLASAVFFTCYVWIYFFLFAWWFQHWWLQLQQLVTQWLRCPLTPSSSSCHLWEQASPLVLQIQSTRSVILRKRSNKVMHGFFSTYKCVLYLAVHTPHVALITAEAFWMCD